MSVQAADWRKLFTSSINHQNVIIDLFWVQISSSVQLRALHTYNVLHSLYSAAALLLPASSSSSSLLPVTGLMRAGRRCLFTKQYIFFLLLIIAKLQWTVAAVEMMKPVYSLMLWHESHDVFQPEMIVSPGGTQMFYPPVFPSVFPVCLHLINK